MSGRDRIVSLRLSDDEYGELTELANTVGISPSELVRRAALSLTYPPPPACVGGTSAAPLVRMLIGAPGGTS